MAEAQVQELGQSGIKSQLRWANYVIQEVNSPLVEQLQILCFPQQRARLRSPLVVALPS